MDWSADLYTCAEYIQAGQCDVAKTKYNALRQSIHLNPDHGSMALVFVMADIAVAREFHANKYIEVENAFMNFAKYLMASNRDLGLVAMLNAYLENDLGAGEVTSTFLNCLIQAMQVHFGSNSFPVLVTRLHLDFLIRYLYPTEPIIVNVDALLHTCQGTLRGPFGNKLASLLFQVGNCLFCLGDAWLAKKLYLLRYYHIIEQASIDPSADVPLAKVLSCADLPTLINCCVALGEAQEAAHYVSLLRKYVAVLAEEDNESLADAELKLLHCEQCLASAGIIDVSEQ